KQLKNNMAAKSGLIFVKVLRFYRLPDICQGTQVLSFTQQKSLDEFRQKKRFHTVSGTSYLLTQWTIRYFYILSQFMQPKMSAVVFQIFWILG
ncbi:hypothetical protein, partial [Blautia luti]|uniref:hypothetical protein n=1 Tax=Blautia luti TaxID=89014 RepID=UPI001A9B2C95